MRSTPATWSSRATTRSSAAPSFSRRRQRPRCAFETAERLVTDGPYAEVKEALGGYFILECGSIDEACELAAKIPAAEHGAIEVRPVHVEEAS